jgi:hypothetical protein
MDQPLGLLYQRPLDLRVSVTRERNPEGTSEVEVDVSVHVTNVGSPRLLPKNRETLREKGDVTGLDRT